MVEALTHRGPDDHGVWMACQDHAPVGHCSSRAPSGGQSFSRLIAPLASTTPGIAEPVHLALGHTRLAVIDLSPAGHQPMVDPRTGNRIVYNGEVYNFREIRRSLEQRGVRFRSDCDTEVLLHAYAEWGAECVQRFRGMFAFAIWDQPARRLFLARDRLGIKPLYYVHDTNGFMFASEVRALLASGRVRREISPSALSSYLAFGSISEPETIVAGVRMLPAGHTAVFDGGELTLQRYWGLDGCGWETEPAPRQRTTEAVLATLQEAVRLRLVSDAPIGVFLSGGIDSSALVALMTRVAPGQAQTVSVGFAEAGFDETVHADTVARRYGTDHHTVILTASDVLMNLERALNALDQPSIDGLNTWFVSRAARGVGLTVTLSGLGGDELFAGYPGFRTLPRLERLRQLATLMPSSLRAAASWATRRLPSRPGTRSVPHKLADLLAFAPHFQHAGVIQRMLFGPTRAAELLRSSDAEAVLPAYQLSGELLTHQQSPIRQLSTIECGHYMRNTLLRDVDVMSMAHALEVRVPLIDHHLVEMVMALDDGLKLDNRTPKPLLVRALGSALPGSVVRRPKQGFAFPFDVWLRGGMGRQVRDALCSGRSPVADLLDPVGLARVWTDFAGGRLSWSRPWALFVLNHWLEQHLAK